MFMHPYYFKLCCVHDITIVMFNWYINHKLPVTSMSIQRFSCIVGKLVKVSWKQRGIWGPFKQATTVHQPRVDTNTETHLQLRYPRKGFHSLGVSCFNAFYPRSSVPYFGGLRKNKHGHLHLLFN